MKNKIKKLLEANEKISLSKVATELNMPFIEVLRNTESVRTYDIEKIDDLFETLREWKKVFLLVVTPSFVMEIQDKFPKGFYAHGYLNFHDKNSTIGGHLTVGNIKEIFIVEDIMFGRKSCSIKFFGEDEKEIFSVYVPRDEKKELIAECLESFYNL
nr:heme utilization cystosolic carrier protein HutX [uncultured Cetobacterium sp.]